MKNITNIILGLLLVVLISATTTDIMTVKPEKPISTKVKYFSDQYDASEVSFYIETQINKGWIVKEVEGANDGKDYSTWIVVLEKY